jgi:ABC-2 type transport system ATP-binding protein/ribosome-dependent ATPase
MRKARDRLVSDLPLGIRRQVAFLCALQHRPDVLVLDEPSSGVEPLGRARLWDQIREQSQRGVGVLVTTHYMQEAQQCDRLLLMSQGRLVAQGTEADIVDGTTAIAVASDDWARVFAVLSGAGLAVNLAGRDVRVIDPDPAVVRQLLAGHGIEAGFHEVPATIEERMTMLART